MGLGFGSLKQMNDTIRYNRDLLGKKKSVREIYKDEIKRRGTNVESQNLEFVRLRVVERLKRNRSQEIFARLASVVIILLILSTTIWAVSTIDFKGKKKSKNEAKEGLFNTIVYKQLDGLELTTEYFIHGPKAAETLYKDGLRHQTSESYYESLS